MLICWFFDEKQAQKNSIYFEIEIIINAFTVSFDKFNVSLVSTSKNLTDP